MAILGGGYTGLWTAYYLLRAEPSLRVTILERDICGFGASGRNGAWCAPGLNISLGRLEKLHGRDAARATYEAVFDAVDEVGRVARERVARHRLAARRRAGRRARPARDAADRGGARRARALRLRRSLSAARCRGALDDGLRIDGATGALFSPARGGHPPGQARTWPGARRRAHGRDDPRGDRGDRLPTSSAVSEPPALVTASGDGHGRHRSFSPARRI